MLNRLKIDRRRALRGLGVSISIALPVLEAMLDSRGRLFATAEAATAPTQPVRLWVWSFGNGTRMNAWDPSAAEGPLVPALLSPCLKPLGDATSLLSSLTLVTGLDHKQTVQAGAHDGVFIGSGGPNVKNDLSPFPLPGDASVDQIAGDALGGTTKLRTLPISNDKDELINWAITSWGKGGTPVQPYRSTQQIFDKLFSGTQLGGPSAEVLAAQKVQKSILDFALEDGVQLMSSLGAADKLRVQQHLDAIRETENQLSASPSALGAQCANVGAPAKSDPSDGDFVKRGRIMMDLLVLAMQCDLTRYGTFNFQNSDNNWVWPGMSWQDHTASHDAPDDIIVDITQRKLREFLYLIQKLENASEVSGSVLDNSLIMMSSEIGQGNAHDTKNLPVLIAGRGGGLVSGRFLKRAGANYNNMLCSLLNYAGVTTSKFGIDGSGPLSGL